MKEMQPVYVWAGGLCMPISADTFARACHHIMRERGELTPDLVVEAARPESSPIHDMFEWDDRSAAERYRLAQAAAAIRTLRVRVRRDDDDVEVRAFVRVLPSPEVTAYLSSGAEDAEEVARATARGRYIAVTDALAHHALRASVLATAMRELEAFRRKYATLAELSEVLSAIDRALGGE